MTFRGQKAIPRNYEGKRFSATDQHIEISGLWHFFSKKEKACKQAGKQVNVSPGYSSKENEKRGLSGDSSSLFFYLADLDTVSYSLTN